MTLLSHYSTISGVSHRVVRGFQRDTFIRLREEAGMKRTDLARFANVSPATIGIWERKDGAPDVRRLAQVAEALGAQFSDLVFVPESERMPSDWRIAKGLSQIEVGRLAGLSTTVVGSFERAEVKWKQANAEKIAAVLDVDVEVLRAAWERARTRPPGAPA